MGIVKAKVRETSRKMFTCIVCLTPCIQEKRTF
jgi:hypothetical protein